MKSNLPHLLSQIDVMSGFEKIAGSGNPVN
jgi:hypothetical protein